MFRSLSSLAVAALALSAAHAVAEPVSAGRRNLTPYPALAAPAPAPVAPVLPPLPEGVEELSFSEFFKAPVGPRGLEFSDRIRALDGQRVRLLGFMVREEVGSCNSCVAPSAAVAQGRRRPAWLEHLVPGRMILAPRPVAVSMGHYGLCDDLPPQTLFVTVPERFGEPVPFTPGPLLLTGTLTIGNHAEPDGRISVLRLSLDPRNANPPAASAAGVASHTIKTTTTKDTLQ